MKGIKLGKLVYFSRREKLCLMHK